MTTTSAPEQERALETDTAVREANLAGCIGFMLLRHGALLGAKQDNPHKDIYRQARESAEREIVWRFARIEQQRDELRTAAQALIDSGFTGPHYLGVNSTAFHALKDLLDSGRPTP